MKFWDSSALVPLVLEESRSAACRAVARADRIVIAWMFAETECLGAIHRARAADRLTDADLVTAEQRLTNLARAWRVVVDADAVRDEAGDVIRRHRLRAADGLQLAAARVWANRRPRGRGFVVADVELARAAAVEGFDVRDLST